MTKTIQPLRLVIIGAGMAGSKLANDVLHDAHAHYHVTLIGEEKRAGYNRIMLSSLLANEVKETDMALVNVEEMAALGGEVITQDAVIDICQTGHYLTLQSQRKIPYDKLVFATGSRASILPIEGSSASNVMGFRDWQDVQRMSSLPAKSSICVIGGGLLGLEAAVGLVKRGHKVSLIHRGKHILNRQLDTVAASLLQSTLEKMGITFYLQTTPKKLLLLDSEKNTARVNGVLLDSFSFETFNAETVIATDLVVMATGITPEVGLAKQAQLSVGKAIKVNAFMETSHDNIYALGECCEFDNSTFGLVAPIWQQLETLMQRLKGIEAPFQLRPIPTQLKVSGVQLFSVGEVSDSTSNSASSTKSSSITFLDASQNHYRRLFIKDNKLVGAILYGDVMDGSWYFELIQQQTPLTHMLDEMIFGAAYCQSAIQTPATHVVDNIAASKTMNNADNRANNKASNLPKINTIGAA